MNTSLSSARADRRGRWIAVGLAFGLFAAAASGQWAPGQPLPDLSTFGLAGLLPDSFAGRVVLVDFWASWCGPCKASFPVLDGLQKKYADRGLVVLAVSVDEKADAKDRFLAEHPVSFAVVHDLAQRLVAAAGISAMPSSFLVDRKGVIRFAHTGFKPESTPAELEREIESLLAEEHP